MPDQTLPDGAYEAADEAFETFRVTEDKRPRDELEAALLAAEPLIRADERDRLRTHEHEWTRCPDCRQPGQPCPCSGVPCCEMERRETAAANEASGFATGP